MSELDLLKKKRLLFMKQTADQQPTLDQWNRWHKEASVPERHRQEVLPGVHDRSLRRGFRGRRAGRTRTSIYSCRRPRPGRESRWADQELRETDSFAVSTIPSAILEESHLSPADRRVLLALLIYSRGRESWTMYMAPIANMARVARSTAHLSVARLVRAGYIGRVTNPVTGSRNGPNTWTLLDARLLLAAEEMLNSKRRDSGGEAESFSFGDRVQKNDPVNHINYISSITRSTAPDVDPRHNRLGAAISASGAAAPPYRNHPHQDPRKKARR